MRRMYVFDWVEILTADRVEDFVHVYITRVRPPENLSSRRTPSSTHNTHCRRSKGSVGGIWDIRRTNSECSHEVVPGPLGEERNGNHDPQTPPVARSLDETQPANIRGDFPVKLDSSPDLLELVLDERVSAAQRQNKPEKQSKPQGRVSYRSPFAW